MRRAFSLIEILISVVVLALGLLGLAAVFPAVVTQQRAATDAVMAGAIQNAVEDYLRQQAALNKPSNPVFFPQNSPNIAPGQQRGWQLLTANQSWSPPAMHTIGYDDGDWYAMGVPPSLNTSDAISMDAASGTMWIIGSNGAPPPDPASVAIPIAQRLWPTPYTSGAQPLYVWDFITRRVASGITADPNAGSPTGTDYQATLQDDSVQAAVFVRRIDAGIRKPPDRTLADVLTGSNLAQPTDRRVPVAEDANSRPTFDGMGGTTGPNYSPIHVIAFTPAVRPGGTPAPTYPPGSYITLDSSSTMRDYVKQPGQKLVDSYGVVHTVTTFLDKYPTENPDTIEVTPPFDVGQPANGAVDLYSVNTWINSSGRPAQVWFTPQIPAAVFVVTVPTPQPGSN